MTLAASGNAFLLLQPVDRTSPGLMAWWTILCVVSLCNIWMWWLSARALANRRESIAPPLFTYQRWQLILCAGYVLGCAFRAIVPRADVQRFGLFDTWISSVFVGRSVATVAELCFAAQWAMFLHHVSRQVDSRVGMRIAFTLVPLIFVAEICSWYGVLTTAYIGNTIEESIWALSGALLTFGMVWIRGRAAPPTRALLTVAIGLGALYVVYMCCVDVPMYASRWLADEANGRQYLTLSQGLWDANSRWIVTHAWDEWHPEMPWMSLYFSVGVWCSLALVHLPWLAERERFLAGLSETARLSSAR